MGKFLDWVKDVASGLLDIILTIIGTIAGVLLMGLFFALPVAFAFLAICAGLALLGIG